MEQWRRQFQQINIFADMYVFFTWAGRNDSRLDGSSTTSSHHRFHDLAPGRLCRKTAGERESRERSAWLITYPSRCRENTEPTRDASNITEECCGRTRLIAPPRDCTDLQVEFDFFLNFYQLTDSAKFIQVSPEIFQVFHVFVSELCCSIFASRVPSPQRASAASSPNKSSMRATV